jgi:formylglycine-generating enzyme required for sulfatase activity
VGLKEPNAWGLYDMLGNVLEWCAACHGAISELKSLDPTGPVEDEICVSRGGSWFHHAARCKSTSRLESSPSYLSGFIGFRLALDSSTTPK